MRTITRFVAAILAAIGLSAPLVAAPAASWVNFSGGINNDGTITYYGSSVNTATVTGGTWNAEGGYLQLGDSTTPTNGSITLQLPATITSAMTVTVMLDVAGIPTTDATLIQLSLSSGGKVSLKATSSQLKQVWNASTTDYGTLDYASEARKSRQMIALAYSSGSGTNTFIDGVQKITNSGLKASNNTISAITIGVVQGLKVYGIYLYASQLSATQVATEMAAARAEIMPDVSVSMTRNGAANDNTIKVATLRKGATSSVTDFEATFGTSVANAKAARNSANTTNEATTFFKGSWSSCVNTNVKSGYPMVCNKFLYANSDYYWHLWVPITLESTDVFNEVLPELYPTTSGGEDQGAAATFFNYTISLYEGTVFEGTKAVPIATATGTTSSTLGLNTARATLDNAISGRSGVHTLKIEVKPNTCGGGAYSGIRSVQFFNRTTASRAVSGDAGTWSTGWTGDAPGSGADVTLTVSDAATLAMDAPASLAFLTVNDGSDNGSASLTFSGEQSLTSSATILNVDTDVSAITANLGAVTVASGKKLTVGVNTSASSWALGGSTLATKGDFTTPEAVWGALIASTAADRPATLLVESGTLALKANISTDKINYAVEVAPEATLDINGVYDTCPSSLTLGEGATLCNGGNDTTTQKIQWTNLVLAGDATLSGNTFASIARSWGSQSIILGGHTLTVAMNEGKTFYLASAGAQLSAENTSAEAGTVKVTSGTLSLYSDQNADSLKRANVVLAGGTLYVEGKGLLGSLAGESGTLNLSNKDVPIGYLNKDTTFAGAVSGTGIFRKVGTGTQTLSGDLSGFSGAYQVDEGTLEVVNATDKTLSNTISGTGTVKKSGAGTLTLTGTVSTLVELAEGTLNLGTSRPAVTVTGAGTTLKLTLTPDEALTGRTVLETTLGDGVTSYTLEVSFCGTTKSATKSASGVVTFPAYEATKTGNSWWWDYEFNGNVTNTGSDTTSLTKDVNDPTYDNNTALNLSSTPYRDATYPAEFTAVMYAKAGANAYGGLLAFGTKSGGAISLVCGAYPAKGQVRLIYSLNETVTELISAEAMSVPNATTANHLYAFTKRIEDGNTVIDVYLDGRKLAHYAFSGAATIGGGFQVGSLHGGVINNAIAKATSGTVDFLRVSNTALSDEAIAVLAAEYSYTSPNGKATRTVTNADTAWSAEGAWTEGENTVAAPTAGKVVELTASSNASLAVALEADVSYESLKFSGEGTVALTREGGTTGCIVVQGVTTVETDTTVDARAVKLTGLTIAEGKRLTIDCSGLVLLQDTYRLTGYIDEATFQRILVTPPSDTPFIFEATHDNTGFVVLRATAVKDLAATVSTDTSWADVPWTWAGHDTPTALQTTTIDNATLTFANDAAISPSTALTVRGTLTASGAGSIDLPSGSTVNTTLLSDSATVILHQSQAEVVSTRSGSGGTFKFVGGTTDAPLVVPYNVAFPGAIAVAADSCVKLECTTGSDNVSYQVSGAGQSSKVILTSDHNWGVLNTGSVTSIFRKLTLSLGGTKDFWFRAGLTDNVWLDIQSGRTLKQEDDAPNTNVGGVLTVRNLTGNGTFESLNPNQTLRLLNTDPAASTFNAVPTIKDGKTNFKLVFAGNWTVGAALTDAKTPPIIHIGDGTTETTVETAVAFAPGAAYTVQANATLRPTAAAAALPASLTLAEGGKVQLTLDTLTLPSALSGTGSVLFGNGTDTFAYTLASAPANFTGTYNVAANSTLTLTSAPNGSAGFAGSGTLVIGNGTAATNVTSTKAYPDATQPLTVQVKSPSKLTLNPGAGNFAFPNAVAFDVASGAELILASGMSFFGVSGEGSCSVTGDYVFGVSASDFQNGAKVLNVATLTVGTDTNPEVTLSVRPFGAIAIAPTTLKVNKNAVIARDSNTSATASASLSIGATATVTGEGTIELPVAFTEGAVLDTVTAAPLLLKGKVTGTIKVKLNTAKAVLSTSSDVEFDRNTQLAFASDDASQEFAGYRFAETVFGTTHTFTVVPPLELPGSLPEAVSGNKAAQDAIYDAVAALGSNITSVTAVTAQSTGGAAGSTEALALFENLYAQATPGEKLTENTYAGTVTVYYDFGISQLHVKRASLGGTEDPQLYVLLCAKVATKQDTSTADYATGTIVTLYKGDTPVNTALTPDDEKLKGLGIEVSKGEKWFAVPMADLTSGTNAFTVKATK